MSEVELIFKAIDETKAATNSVTQGLAQAGKRIQAMAAESKKANQQMADDFTRLGSDFRKLGGNVDDWIGRLKASTPVNAQFAMEASRISQAFESGTMTASEAASAFEQLKGEMMSARPVTEQLADGFKFMAKTIGISIAAIYGANEAFKKAMDFGEAGAAVYQTSESFGILMEKVGATPGLLEKLRTASRGTVSDMQIMASTATLLAGANGELATALADATPELMEIAKAANKLNPSLGDTTFLYESLAKGIKRASPMILDNLGLIIKVGEANETYAKSVGKTVEQLTAEEQKIALLNETLRQGKVLMEQAGNSTESATDSFQQLDAAWTNLTNLQKQRLSPALSEVAEWMTRVTQAQVDSKTTWMTYIPILQQAEAVMNILKGTFGGTKAASDALTESQKNAISIQQESIDSLTRMSGSLSMAGKEANAAATSMSGLTTSVIDLTKANLGTEAIKNLDEAMKEGRLTQEEYDTAFNNVALTMLELPPSTVVALTNLRNLNAEFAAGEHTAGEYTSQIMDLHSSIQRMEGKEITVKVNVDIPDWDKLNTALSLSGSSVSTYVAPKPATRGRQGGYASGGDFIVPPGFPRDSYQIGVSSGERVTVQTQKQQQQAQRSAVNFYGPVTFQSYDPSQLTEYGVN